MATNSSDVIATMGLTAEDFEKGLKKADAEYQKFNKRIEAENKKNQVKQAATFLASTALANNFTEALREGGYAASSLTASLDKLDVAKFQDATYTVNAGTRALINFGGAALGAAESIPILGSAVTLLTSPFRAAAEDTAALKNIGVEINKQVAGYDQLLQKFQTLGELRTKEREKGVHGARLAYEELQFETARNQIAEQYANISSEIVKAHEKDSTVLQENVALAELEIKKAEQIAAARNSVRNPDGSVGKAGAVIAEAAVARIEAQAEAQRKALEISKQEKQAQKSITEAASKTGIEIEDQIDLQRKISSELAEQAKQAFEVYKVENLVVLQKRAEAKQAENTYKQSVNAYDLQKRAAQDATAGLNAQLAGNAKLAAILKTQLDFGRQIVAAKQAGNAVLAQELAKQQALSILLIKAQDYLKTPSQRRKERAEQRKMDRAIRAVNSRDRVNAEADARGAYGRRSSRDYVSPSAQKARDQFVARNAPKALAGNQAVNTPVITAGTLTVQTLQSGK